MQFYVNLILPVNILFLIQIRFFAIAKECVIRESGACKAISLTNAYTHILVNEFGSAPPDGFQIKTTIEVNLLTNKYSFEKNLPIEEKLPIGYELDNAAEVSIQILGIEHGEVIIIRLGERYYRMATLTYKKDKVIKKHNHYTPVLPRFPYILHLEITTNGTLSIYADTNTEPFFWQDLGSDFVIKTISLSGVDNLIAFYDCSIENKPDCGTYYIDELYENGSSIKVVALYHCLDFRKRTILQILDEYVVVDTKKLATMIFSDKYEDFNDRDLIAIVFLVNAIEVRITFNKRETKKIVRTEKWFQQPANPYFVRVLLSNGTGNNFLNITNIRGDTIISMKLCGKFRSLNKVQIHGPSLYFDCLRPSDDNEYNNTLSQRRREHIRIRGNTIHSDNGFNFTKSYLGIRDYLSEDEPLVLYEYDFGFSKEDWCDKDPDPKLYVKPKTNVSGATSHTEQQEHAVNATIVNNINNYNNYNYYFNNINVTELPKFLKQN